MVVVSSVPEREKALSLGAQAFLPKPLDRRLLMNTLNDLRAGLAPMIRVLVVDDEEVARFVVRQCLPRPAFDVIEAAGGEAGLARARTDQPDVILLDLVMPGVGGFEVLQRLREDSLTRDIPVVIVTSQALEERERAQLHRDAQGLISKADLSRESLSGEVRRVAENHARGFGEPVSPPPPL